MDKEHHQKICMIHVQAISHKFNFNTAKIYMSDKIIQLISYKATVSKRRLVKQLSQPQAFKLVIFYWVSPPSNWKSLPFLEVASGHGQQNDKILFMFS